MSYKDDIVEPGSKWVSTDFVKFQVIDTTEINGQKWVYYRKLKSSPEECREYSCFLESFLNRFTKIVNE